jgi:hypothetical protein
MRTAVWFMIGTIVGFMVAGGFASAEVNEGKIARLTRGDHFLSLANKSLSGEQVQGYGICAMAAYYAASISE